MSELTAMPSSVMQGAEGDHGLRRNRTVKVLGRNDGTSKNATVAQAACGPSVGHQTECAS